MNKKRKSKFVGPCVILYLPTSIEPLRFEHRRNRTKRQYYRRRALGSIKNRKTVEKKIIQNRETVKKNCSKPITACKTIKTNKVSHSSYPNPNRSNTEVKSGAKRDFRSYERSVEAKNCRSDRRKTEKQKRKNRKPHRISNPKNKC